MKSHKPIIGIILDWKENGDFSRFPHYALRTNYFQAIHKSGGIPLAIPYIHEEIDEYLEIINGLVIPGGGYAFPEEWYADKNEPPPYKPSPRLAFDLEITEKALIKNMPVLGICAGMQIIGGINGCKMTRNVKKYLGTEMDHWGDSPEKYAHEVQVMHGTTLEKITERNNFPVNTRHREALVEIPDNVTINCIAPDKVVEGIELPHYKFVIGVQWHPEFFAEQNDSNMDIFRAFIKISGA